MKKSSLRADDILGLSTDLLQAAERYLPVKSGTLYYD
jgi:hypothetical protein